MNKKFVTDDFIVPEKLETDKFRLRMLTVDDVEKDYEAVMSSCEQLRNPEDENSWPKKNMTLKEDLQDLQVHQNEFLNRVAFAYTVMSLDESICLGCVYLDPSEKELFDAEVYMWVRTSELKNGLDELLYGTVRNWVKERWPFKSVTYPGREITWEEWKSISSGDSSELFQ
jgi:hypothetical protein